MLENKNQTMSEAEKFLKEYSDIERQYGNIEITYDGLCQMLESYHNQHKPSDEEIIEIAKQWSVKENPKEDVIASQIIKALNILCDKIFKL